ncbi:stage V sporulation protein AB [Thermohalobacter berrensis]|uniref:stage V sporulation protein AB n=1 Tax=Thermohalobacter berrensis TaxID=99594 RepID=UPI001602D561|nr:stage V sporulation protein AB [Thermohalobacter berrensis]
MIQKLFLAFFGLSGGVVVGSSFAAIVTLLDIVPRLSQLANSTHKISLYEKVITVSVVTVSLLYFLNITLNINKIILLAIGLVMGIFIGLLAAALAEVLNVIPVLVRRFSIINHLYYVLMSMAFGKIIGSLVQWLVLINYD